MVYVIDEADKIIGIITLIPKEGHLYLGNLAIISSRQGRGIGRRLMAFAEKLALKQGFPEIRLFTNELMHEVISIYKSYGYEETDRKTEDGFNRVYFVKYLNKIN